MGTEYLDDSLTFAQFAEEMTLGTLEKGVKLIGTTATDFVTTTLNSALGIGQAVGIISDDAEELRTEDLLRQVSSSLGDFYLDNKDLVEGLSFGVGLVGGVGAGIKSLNSIRAGAQKLGRYEGSNRLGQIAQGTMDVFTGSKKKQLTAEMEKVFAEAGGAAGAFTKLKTSLYADAAINFNLDNIAAEIAIIGTLNAHPYMQDYTAELGSNFLHSVGIGALFTPLAMPAAFRHVKQIIQPIENKAWGFATKESSPVSEQFGYTNAANYQLAKMNLMRISELLLRKDLNPLTREYLTDFGDQFNLKSLEALTKMVKGWPELTPGVKEQIQTLISREAFSQIERIRTVKFPDMANVKTPLESITDVNFKPSPISKIIEEEEVLDILEFKTKEKKRSTVFYRPLEDTWYSASGIQNIGRAVDLKNQALNSNRVNLTAVVTDFDAETLLRANSSGVQDLRFLSELEALQDASPDFIEKYLKIDSQDLPRLNAVLGWMGRHPQDVKNLKYSILTNGEKTTLTYKEVEALYQQRTVEMINSLTRNGTFSYDEIASRLNVTKAAAMHVAAGGSLDQLRDWRRYTNPALIEEDYLSPDRGLLMVSSNRFKNPLPELVSNLDAMSYQKAHLDYMEHLVMSKGNKMIKDAFAVYNNPEMVNGVQFIRSFVNELNNSMVGNPRWQSADNMVRDLKGTPENPVKGEFLTYIGQQVVKAMDKITEDLIKPMVPHFSNMTNTTTQGVEFAATANMLAGLSEYRQMVINPENGYAFFIRGKAAKDAKLEELLTSAILNSSGEIFYVKQPEVIKALEATQDAARELFTFHNILREFRGMKPLENLGFYLPPPSLINKHYSYVLDSKSGTPIQIILANTAKELKDKEVAFRQLYPNAKIISRDMQLEFNKVSGYVDGSPYITQANIALKHGGSSQQAITPQPEEFINQIFSGFEYQIKSAVRKFNELYLHDITATLDQMAQIYDEGLRAQPLFGINKTTFGAKNSPVTIKNLLLGRDNREISTTWKFLDDTFDLVLGLGVQAINKTVAAFETFGGSKDVTKIHKQFDILDKELAKLEIENPWRTFDSYYATRFATTQNIQPKLISTGNSLSALFQLRLFDAGFLIANALSIPILGTAALTQKFATLTTQAGNKFFAPMKLLMDGVAHRWSPEGKRIQKIFEEEGHLNQAVRQYADVNGLLQTVQRGQEAVDSALYAVDSFINSGAVRKLAKPADFVENLTREMAMHIGFATAKRAYPGIGDKGAIILAVNYADRAIGNYFAAQRPVFFQGTLGSAISLYQTYMLTYAQSLFRDLEAGAFKNLARTFLLQAGIFGLNSLPGYNALSEMIAKAYSYDNTDLTTGAYRMVGPNAGDLLLYGLPSNLLFDSALYTRGDITPRVPNIDNIAIYNTLTRGFDAMTHGVNAAVNAEGFGGKLRALGESVSLQTINRPSARLAEIFLGNSITRQGNTVQTPAEVWTISGVMSRILALRPLEEQKLRNAVHLNSSYGTADFENRQEAINALRIAIRNDSLTSELIETVAEKYIRNGGSSKGFDAALNDVMLRTEFGTRYDLRQKLEPDSPIRRLIDDNF